MHACTQPSCFAFGAYQWSVEVARHMHTRIKQLGGIFTVRKMNIRGWSSLSSLANNHFLRSATLGVRYGVNSFPLDIVALEVKGLGPIYTTTQLHVYY